MHKEIKKVIKGLNKASKSHAGQAKTLTKIHKKLKTKKKASKKVKIDKSKPAWMRNR